VKVGDPADDKAIGPVASRAQFDKIQGLLQKGIDEGATLVAGGPGRPTAWTPATTSSPPCSPTCATT
jgi:acyl-CoA reductase-like NAD-dependent aldehyde dehydrogenase